MDIIGIIAEYNPFHNGHQYHLQTTKQKTNADYIIVIMSSSFVQRGEPAIIDKLERTKMALLNGADAVIELPVLYSTASAEYFAKAAIKLLEDIGCVTMISFGSESGTIEDLKQIADIVANETNEFKEELKKQLSSGCTFPVARANALNQIKNINSELLSNPNNILAVEYLKALKNFHSNIVPITIQRKGAHYHNLDITQTTASASAIRKSTEENQTQFLFSQMPQNCCEIFTNAMTQGSAPIYLKDFSSVLNYRLRTLDSNELKNILDITEGLENRILRSIYSNYEIKQICEFIKTKRYTFTKIQRILTHILLDIKKEDFYDFNQKGFSQYIRILGFKKESHKLIQLITSTASIPVLINTKKMNSVLTKDGLKMLKLEIKATNLHCMVSPNPIYRKLNKDFLFPIIL